MKFAMDAIYRTKHWSRRFSFHVYFLTAGTWNHIFDVLTSFIYTIYIINSHLIKNVRSQGEDKVRRRSTSNSVEKSKKKLFRLRHYGMSFMVFYYTFGRKYFALGEYNITCRFALVNLPVNKREKRTENEM